MGIDGDAMMGLLNGSVREKGEGLGLLGEGCPGGIERVEELVLLDVFVFFIYHDCIIKSERR